MAVTKKQVFGLYAKYRYLLRRDRHAVGTSELVAVCEMIDEIASLEEKFELLNTNVADRADITEIVNRSGHGDMVVLVSMWHADDSVNHREDRKGTDGCRADDPVHTRLAMHFAKEFGRMREECREIDPDFYCGIASALPSIFGNQPALH